MPPQRSTSPLTTNQQQPHSLPSSCSSMKVLSTHKRISLWLIPPEPVLSSLTRTQHQLITFQQDLDNNNKNHRELPTFVPHVTLVGGIPLSECCSVQDDVMPSLQSSSSCIEEEKKEEKEEEDTMDEVAAKSLLKRLARAFHNFGGVECTFVKERGVFAARRQQRRMEAESVTNDLITRSPTSVTSTIISGDDWNKSNNNDDNEEGEVQWNQSCISIMERSNTFLKAMELVERILYTDRSSCSNSTTRGRNEIEEQQSVAMQTLERHFKAPVCEPHYSFVYGNDAELISSLRNNDSPRSVNGSTSSSNSSANGSSSCSGSGKESFVLECPPNFTCTEIAVVWTYPSCLEGVKQWREIGRFTLVEEKTSKYWDV